MLASAPLFAYVLFAEGFETVLPDCLPSRKRVFLNRVVFQESEDGSRHEAALLANSTGLTTAEVSKRKGDHACK
jgi:hypothetical protein